MRALPTCEGRTGRRQEHGVGRGAGWMWFETATFGTDDEPGADKQEHHDDAGGDDDAEEVRPFRVLAVVGGGILRCIRHARVMQASRGRSCRGLEKVHRVHFCATARVAHMLLDGRKSAPGDLLRPY